VIYQETEFMENFTIPLKSILSDFNYSCHFITMENIFNLSTTHDKNTFPNLTNNYFSLQFKISNFENYSQLIMIENIDLLSERKIINEYEIYSNTFKKSFIDKKFDIKYYNDSTFLSPLYEEQNILYDSFNITINQDSKIDMFMFINYKTDILYCDFKLLGIGDNIINVNKNEFFKPCLINESLDFTGDFSNAQYLYFNFAVVKLIDDLGIIFSKESDVLNIKQESKSYFPNKNYMMYSIIKIEFSRIMKQYNRIYKKLQNVFADLGGLFNTLIIIGNILVAQINKKKFDFDVMNKIFSLENENIEIKNNLNEILNKVLKSNDKATIKSKKINSCIDENSLIINLEEKIKSIISLENNKNKDNNENKQSSLTIINKNLHNQDFNFYRIKSNNDNQDRNFITNSCYLVKEENTMTKNINNYLSNQNVELKDLNYKENKVSDVCKIDKNLKFSMANEEDISLNEKIDLLLKNKKKKSNKNKLVELSIFEFFYIFFPCKRIKNKSLIEREYLIIKSERLIAKYLDESNYFKLFERFEKLKLIILNNPQAFSFNFIKNRNPSEIFKENYKKNYISQFNITKIDSKNLIMMNMIIDCLKILTMNLNNLY